MDHRWCKERTDDGGGSTAEGETHRQVAMGERKKDKKSGKEAARVQGNNRFRGRWQLNECRMMKKEKKKKNQCIIREAAGQAKKKRSERVPFPLSQERPPMLCSLLLPHSLSSVPPRSRQCCGVSAPLPSPPRSLLTFTLPHSAATARADQSGLRNSLRGI